MERYTGIQETTDKIEVGYEKDVIDNCKSPFSIYEEKFCNRCSDYNGCIGLVSSTSTSIGIEDTEGKINTKTIGDKMFLDMVKGMGVSLYTHKFKMLLECMQARKLINDI